MKKKIFALAVAAMAVLGAQAQDTYRGHEYVDLGLASGTLWATESLPIYYRWGETEVVSETYKFGDSYPYTKYNSDDNTMRLLPEDDAAYVNWGGLWTMPTKDQVHELYDNTTVSYDNDNKILTLTSKKNGKSINFIWSGGRGALLVSKDLYSMNSPHCLYFNSSYTDCIALGGKYEDFLYESTYVGSTIKRVDYSPVRPVLNGITKVNISGVPEGWKVNGIEPTNGSVSIVAGERLTVIPANIPEGKKIKSIKLEP